MKRDIDLIRTILLKMETDPRYSGTSYYADASTLNIEEQTPGEVIYHVVLLIEAGFLVGNTKLAKHGTVIVSKLSWQGHEFLADIRDPEVWRKTKERANAIDGVSIAFIWEVAKAEVKERLGLT